MQCTGFFLLLLDDMPSYRYLYGMDNEEKDKQQADAKAPSDGGQNDADDKGEAKSQTDNTEGTEQSSKTGNDDAAKQEQGKVTDGVKEGVSQEDKSPDLAAENASLRDQLLRLAADFDNYRKRMVKEKAEAIEYANDNLLSDLLDPLDNLERTLQAAVPMQDGKAEHSQGEDALAPSANDASVKAIVDGVKMTQSALLKVLMDKYGLSSYGAAGEAFDASCHQALHSEADTEGGVKVPSIKEVYQKGYRLHNKIIRHAKVRVVTPKE